MTIQPGNQNRWEHWHKTECNTGAGGTLAAAHLLALLMATWLLQALLEAATLGGGHRLPELGRDREAHSARALRAGQAG